MPVAPISADVHLFYEDTGVPNGSTVYTTLVLIHGVIFHGATFRRLLPYAATHNLRIVRLNLREYPGSSPYTPFEVEAFRSADPQVLDAAVQAYGAEVAAFLAWFAESNSIPAPRRDPADGSTEGGMAVLVWSSTNSAVVSMLAHASELPEQTLRVLDTHLRAYIALDASVSSLGITPPASLYSPVRDASLTLAEQNARSAPWLAAYYSNADPHPSRRPDALPPPALEDPPSSLGSLVPVLDEIAAPEVIGGVQGLLLFLDPALFYKNTVRAFGLDHGPRRLENVRIEVVWCDMSMGDCVYAAWAVEQLCAQRAGDLPRVGMHRFEGVNHLAPWDRPQRTMDYLASILRAPIPDRESGSP